MNKWHLVEKILMQSEDQRNQMLAELPSSEREEVEKALENCKKREQKPCANLLPSNEPDRRRYDLPKKAHAAGGMGQIYVVRDPGLDRELALKVGHSKHGSNPEIQERLEREARIVGRLQHPAIVPVHNLGRLPDGRLFFTMKLIRGRKKQLNGEEKLIRTLADELMYRDGTAEESSRLIAVFGQVCQAVAFAHKNRVIHRDLKPANIMVGEFGEVQVMDWGLAKRLDSADGEEEALRDPESLLTAINQSDSSLERRLTQDGDVLGTLLYLPPEQANGEREKHSPKSDVFALGAILCEILTGFSPYVDSDEQEHQKSKGDGVNGAAEIEKRILGRAQLRQVKTGLDRLEKCQADPDLKQIAKDCLNEWESRPADAGEVAARVAKYQTDAQKRAEEARIEKEAAERSKQEAEKREKAERRAKRRLQIVALLFIVILCGGSGLWYLVKRADDERAIQEQKRLKADRDLVEAEGKKAQETQRRVLQEDQSLFAQAIQANDWGDPHSTLKSLCLSRGLDYTRTPELAGLREQQIQSVRRLCSRPRFVWTHPPYPDTLPKVFTAQAINDAAFSPTRLLAATGGDDKMVRFWEPYTGKPRSTTYEHPSPVWRVAFNPDGGRLAAGLKDGRVFIWDLDTNKHEEFAAADNGQGGGVNLLEFSPDGKLLLIADYGRVQVLDPANGKQLFLSPKLALMTAARLSPNGSRVAVASAAGMVRVWDLASGKPVGWQPLRHPASVNAMAFRPDGKVLAIAGEDGNVKFWEPATGTEYESTVHIERPIRAIDYYSPKVDPSGSMLVVVDDYNKHTQFVRNRDNVYLRDRRPFLIWPTPRSQWESPDRRLILQPHHGAVYVWDNASRGQPERTFFAGGVVEAVKFTTDSRCLVEVPYETSTAAILGVRAMREKGLKKWALGEDRVFHTQVDAVNHLTILTMSANGSRVLGLGCDGKTAEVWDLAERRRLGNPLRHPDKMGAAALSADGRRAMTLCADKALRFWNTDTGKQIGKSWEDATNLSVGKFGLSPTGELAFYTDSSKGTFRLWDVANSQNPTWTRENIITCPVFAADGRTLLAVSRKNGKLQAELLEAKTGKSCSPPLDLLGTGLGIGTQGVWQIMRAVLALSPNGKYAAYGDSGGVLVIWPIAEPEKYRFFQHPDSIAWIEFNSDGSRCATAGLDGSARIFNVADGKFALLPLKHPGPVLFIRFSPDGFKLVTVSANDHGRNSRRDFWRELMKRSGMDIYERKQGKELSGEVSLFLNSPTDALRLSQDMTVRVWDIRNYDFDLGTENDLDQLLTGSCVKSGEGGVSQIDLTAEQLAQTWTRTRSNFPKGLTPTIGQKVAWHFEAAVDCEAVSNWGEALTQYDRLIELEPQEWRWQVYRATMLSRLGREKIALQAIQTAHKLLDARREPMYWSQRTQVLSNLKKYDLAAEAATKMIELNPEDWHGYDLRRVARQELRDWGGAEDDCKLTQKSKPPVAYILHLHSALGYILAERGKWDEAVAAFDEAEKNWPPEDRDRILDGVNLRMVRQSAALAALGGGHVRQYRERCKKIANDYLNTSDPDNMSNILMTLCLEPPGEPNTTSELSYPALVYFNKLLVYKPSYFTSNRWGRSLFALSELSWSQHAKDPKVNPSLKQSLFDKIAQDEFTSDAKAGNKLCYRMLLAVLSKRAGLVEDADRWVKEAHTPPPDGWEKELNWIERIRLSSVRAAFDRVLPPQSK